MKRIASEKCLTISIVIVDGDGRQCKLLLALIFNHFAWYWNGINHENLAFPVVCIFLLHNLSTAIPLETFESVCVCWLLRPKAESITRSNFSFYNRVFFFLCHFWQWNSTAQPISLFDEKDGVHCNIWNVQWQ